MLFTSPFSTLAVTFECSGSKVLWVSSRSIYIPSPRDGAECSNISESKISV